MILPVETETVDAAEATGPALPDSLSSLLGFHVRLAHVAIYRDFATAMADLDLTQKQAAVLQIIEGSPGSSQVDIAALLGTDRATMMAIIDRLQDRRLVKRLRSQSDRRRQELYLTPEGETAVARTREIIAAHEKRFTDRFTAAELAALVSALRRIHQDA